jgi:hypothetical protein
MLEGIADSGLSSAVINVALLVSWDALPALLIAYTLQLLLARRIRAEFALRRPEAAELDRALRLYGKVRGRLQAIEQPARRPNKLWCVIFALQFEADPDDAEEREDLQAHAQHLRVTIVALRRLPLERLRSFVRIMSLRFALGCAVAVDIAAFALFFLVFWLSEHPASAHELGGTLLTLVRFPLDQGLFQTNAIGACFAALAVPLVYIVRWSALRSKFGLEFCVLKDLAATAPDDAFDRTGADPDAGMTGGCERAERGAGECFTILGVGSCATAEQVREAYKALIKQSHPDRLADMSPAIRKFAEAETKKLNVAYRQALAAVREPEGV